MLPGIPRIYPWGVVNQKGIRTTFPGEDGFFFIYRPEDLLEEERVFSKTYLHIPTKSQRSLALAQDRHFRTFQKSKGLSIYRAYEGFSEWKDTKEGSRLLEEDRFMLHGKLPQITADFAKTTIREVLEG